MRFVHTADIHLGAQPDKGMCWSQTRHDEIWKSFRRLLAEVKREEADLLLIAGDLFHRQPLLRELKEVNYLFGKLYPVKVVWIAGNHDHLKEDSVSRTFEWAENVYFLDGKECERIYFRDIKTSVYGLSYYQKEIERPLYDELLPEQAPGCHILLAHGGDTKHIPIDRKRVASAGFDYIALGHIHKPQNLVKNRMAYAGALEPIDSGDTGVHGYILGEYQNGRVQTEFVPFACREYVELDLNCSKSDTNYSVRDRLREEIRQYGQEHIYKVRLTGYRSPEIRFLTADYEECGNLLEIIDETVPDYDFEELMQQHAEDVIGRYIRKLRKQEQENPYNSETIQRALYCGLEALQKKKR